MNSYCNEYCVEEDAEKHKKIRIGDNFNAVFIFQDLKSYQFEFEQVFTAELVWVLENYIPQYLAAGALK